MVLGETLEEAQQLGKILQIEMYALATGTMGKTPSLEEALATEIPPQALLRISGMLHNHFVGTPESVAGGIKALADESRADEVMISSWIPFRANREYELRAFKQAWESLDS